MELLAPAGSMEALIAAVQNGADAVYLGGADFNARQSAHNFDEEALREAVSYAHLYGVSVHVTLNTLVFDRELNRVKAFLRLLADIGADAVIVQDLGVAKLVKEHVPTLELHASTQMTVHNLEGVKRLEAIGFSRVVLSRELSLEEIRSICKESNAEIEVFGHGALCVSYSGQCLFSSLVGGRSGNRGQCAQPCRLPYTLLQDGNEVGQKGYLLSPKDLWTIKDIEALKEAGVASLKIEGRLKRPAYVAAAVREYRKAIDQKSIEGAKETLASLFNRDGFTDFYLHGKKGPQMMSTRRPGNHGVFSGKVTGQKGNTVWFRAALSLNKGDLLSLRSEDKETEGTLSAPVLKGESGMVRTAKSVSGLKSVWRMTDTALQTELQKTYESPYQKKITLLGEAYFAPGEKARLTVFDQEGHRAEAFSEEVLLKARDKEATLSDIRQKLLKTGGTPFELSLEVLLKPGVFVPVSVLNQLRREALSFITQMRTSKKHEFLEGEAPDNEAKESERREPYEVVFVQNEAQLKAVLPFSPKRIAVPPALLKSDLILSNKEVSFYAVLPRIIREKDKKAVTEALLKAPVKGVYMSHFGHLPMAKDFPVHGDFSLNVTNQKAILAYRKMGFSSLTLSPEMTLSDGREGRVSELETVVYGRLPLMVMENCPIGTAKVCHGDCKGSAFSLLDRTGARLPILTDVLTHRAEILNSLPLSMTDRMDELSKMASGFQIRFTVEAPKEVAEVMTLVREGRRFLGHYTRGHYDKGV